MAEIEFEDKQSFNPSPLPEVNKCTAENLNEIKESVNFLYTNPIEPELLPEQNLTVELMTAGNLSYNPIYQDGVDGAGATLTAQANGILRDTSGIGLIDSVETPVEGTLIWVKNRTNAVETGPYEITVRGDASTQYILTRPVGYNEASELFPLQINVLFGNVNGVSVWLQITPNPVVGIDPIVVKRVTTTNNQLLPIRFIDTATSEPLPPYTFNPTTKIITFDSVGYFGSLNGCDATLSSNLPNGFRTFLVKDEVGANAVYNGTWRWINVGSSVIAPSMVRVDTQASQFAKENRTFIVSNPYSTLYSKQYCVVPTSPQLTNGNINTIDIYFSEFEGGSGSQTLQQVSDAGGLNNGSTIRQGSVERFGLNGLELVCTNGKIIQWVDGREYYYETGNPIVHCNSIRGGTGGEIPEPTHDETQGFQIGSRFTSLGSGKTYICLDATTENAVWLPMGGEYFPTLDGANGSCTNTTLDKAFYSINNGIVEVSVQGTVDLDFSTFSEGSFNLTFPIEPINLDNVFGNISARATNQFNGLVKSGSLNFYSFDTSFIQNGIKFVAKFSYQAY
jgi:hypothetical protein